MKSNFFDRAKVQRSMDDATRRNLSKIGAFVRKRARHSIRKRKGISEPGSPPSSHVGLVRERIFFAADGPKNVVIGPELLHKVSKTALAALEHGGESEIVDRGKVKRVMVAARPFMQPALEEEKKNDKLAKAWQDSMR